MFFLTNLFYLFIFNWNRSCFWCFEFLWTILSVMQGKQNKYEAPSPSTRTPPLIQLHWGSKREPPAPQLPPLSYCSISDECIWNVNTTFWRILLQTGCRLCPQLVKAQRLTGFVSPRPLISWLGDDNGLWKTAEKIHVCCELCEDQWNVERKYSNHQSIKVLW